MKDIKLVVFDIDGTLLDAGKDRIEDSAVEAIHQLKANGIMVGVATGRSMDFIKEHVKEVLDCDYYVTINGHCTLDRHKEVIIQHPLETSSVTRLLRLCELLKIPMGLKTAHQMVVLNDYQGFYDHYSQGFDVRHLLLDNTVEKDYYLKDTPALGIFLIANVAKMDSYRSDFPEFKFIGAGTHGMDVFRSDINKTKGIEEVLNLVGLRWDNVMVVGDGDNDIEMMKKAALAIAMGNGTAACKDVADYVTGDVDAGGIAQALKHFELI